jgi:16S rRNA (guanine(1405)-N(7))-methyltransferase
VLKKNPKLKGKALVKEVRSILHFKYGMFWLSDKLELKSHKSSRDRLKIYSTLYKDIFSITGEPKRILDLGCGLNPLSYSFLGCKPYYIASELSLKDCDKIKKYFKERKIKGKVLRLDLTERNSFPKADVCFLFAVFDTIEDKGHKLAEQIIRKLDCKYIVVSFSTKTVSGKKMNVPRRGWFERLMKRLGLKYSKLIYPGEMFYVVKCSQ